MRDKERFKLLAVGPLPPPITGEALAVQGIVNATHLREVFQIKVIDRTTEGKSFVSSSWRTLQVLLRYCYLLLTFRPDIVYLSLGQRMRGILRDCLLINLAYIAGTKTVGHLHGGALKNRFKTANWLIRWIMRKSYNKLAAGIVLGKSLTDQFVGILPPHRIRVVHNAAWGMEALNRQHVNKKLARSEPLRILFLSNVLPDKGYFDALSALRILKSKGVQFKFTFAGRYVGTDGYSEEELRKKATDFINKHGLQPWVEEVGVIQGTRKWEVLSSAHVFLLPTYYYEGQPISMIEALHAGCAIICTKRGGIPDIVDEGIGGWFVPTNSPEAIAERIEWIWNHSEWLEKASKHNIEKAKREFSLEQYVSTLVEIFAEICGEK